MDLSTRQQLSMSFRLQRQRGTSAGRLWVKIFALAFGIGIAFLLFPDKAADLKFYFSAEKIHQEQIVASIAAVPDHPLIPHVLSAGASALSLYRQGEPTAHIPEIARLALVSDNVSPPLPVKTEQAPHHSRIAVAIPPRHSTARQATNEHRYALIFEGQATSTEGACAQAQIHLSLNSGGHQIIFNQKTDAAGFFSIPVAVQTIPGAPIDWVIEVSKPKFKKLEQTGRRIAMDESDAMRVQLPFELLRG